MLHSWNIEIFVFLLNPQTSKSVTSSQALVDNGSYTYFWILSTIKMKFGQILVCCTTNISSMFLAECWRLETSSRLFYDFIKMKYSKIWPFLMVKIYHFWLSLIHLFKKTKHWNLDIIDYCVIAAGS